MKIKKIYDLSQPLGPNIPLWPWPGQMLDFAPYRVAFHERGGKSTAVLHCKMHTSTHMDAAFHVSCDGKYIDEIPLENCIGTGVVVSIPTKKWEEITPEMLEAATPKIERGDIVVINTGWHKLFRKDNYAYMNYYGGMYRAAAEWFLDKGVKGVIIDQGALDHPLAHPPLKESMPWLYKEFIKETGEDPDVYWGEYEPCHHLLLDNGIIGVENAGGDMDAATGKRLTIAAFPLRWEFGDGSMVRVVGIEEE